MRKMKKQRTAKCIVGLLSVAILFTSEGLTSLACAGQADNPILPPPYTISEAAPEDENAAPDAPLDGEEEGDEAETGISPADEEQAPSDANDGDPEDPADPEDSDSPSTENPEETEPEDLGDADLENPGETEPEPEVPENGLIPETISDNNTITLNSLPMAVTPVEVKDFDIVDEGGLLISGKGSGDSAVEPQTVYIRQGDSRTFSVRLVDPTPENVDLDEIAEVKWSSSNDKITVKAKDGENGKAVISAGDTALTGQENADITATIGEGEDAVSRICKVTFLPKVTGIVIVDGDGTPIPESGITIRLGEQKKVNVKITPESAVMNTSVSWRGLPPLSVRNSILTVNDRNLPNLPCERELMASVRVDDKFYDLACKVTIAAPDAEAGLRCGDILITGTGLGSYQAVEGKTNEWNANIDRNSQIKFTYKGTAENHTIYYTNNPMGIQIRESGTRKYISASRYKEGSAIGIKPAYPLQLVLATGQRGSETYSDIYTIHFTEKQTAFALSPASISSVPGSGEQELTVTKLPDGVTLDDITWTSGDERIVTIKERTEKGVMLQFGQIVGATQVTAKAKNHREQDCYAVCTVKLSMTLPEPVFYSDNGGEQSEEVTKKDEDGETYTDTNDFWLIDKGGKVTISLRSGTKGDIYYTTNGKDPVTDGMLYQSPIAINAKTKLKACAKREGYNDSPVAESEFRIGDPKLSITPGSLTLKTDENKSLTVKLPTGTDTSSLVWTSSDPAVASAETKETYNNEDEVNGYVHQVTAGTESGRCTVTASVTDYAGRTQTASCVVTVTGKLQITPELTVTEDETSKEEIKLTSKLPTGYSAANVQWSVDAPSLGTLNKVSDTSYTITAGKLTSTAVPQTLIVTASLPMGDETVSARCVVTVMPKAYTVSFFGWKDKLIRKDSVYRGQSATPPTEVEMNAAAPKGYTFDGWKNADTWKNVNGNVDVYAKPYKQISYTITYETGSDGTNSSKNQKIYTVESRSITLEDAVPNNSYEKKFAGWYLDAQYDGSPVDEIPAGSSGDITLYAKWISAKTGLRIEAIADKPYTGKAIKPEVAVYDGETLLTLGKDYTVTYKNNTNANMQPEADVRKVPTVTVSGKGNYGNKDTATFRIIPQSIAADAAEVVIPDLYLAYNNGKKLTVTPTVTWNGKKLRNKTDFAVQSIVKKGTSTNVLEDGCKETGEYTVTIAGKGNFSGTRNISLTVTTGTLMSNVRFNKKKLDDIAWDALEGQTLKEKGKNPVAGIKLTCGTAVLTEGTDYSVSYDENAREVGVYDVTFTGKGSYAGTVTKTFKITGTPIKVGNLDILGWNQTLPYDGTDLSQTLMLRYKKDSNTLIPMILDTDYALTYENAANVGNKATVIITGQKQYTGVVKKTFKITPYSLEKGVEEKRVKITLQQAEVPFAKGGAKPKVTVTYLIPGQTERISLEEGKDYTVKYKNNGKTAGAGEKKSPTFTVTGKGNFCGSVSRSFTIVPQDIGNVTVTAEDVMAAAPNTRKDETIGFTGKGKYKSTPKLTDTNGKALSAGTDFLKTYTFTDENGVVLGPKDQVPENSVLTVTVEGTKNYTGTTKVSYRVLAAKKSLAKASVSLNNDAKEKTYYSLEPVTLKKEDLSVKLNGVLLEKDNFTIISYVNNRKKGTAKVTIQGVGAYGGRKTVNFTIKPQKIAWFKTP